MKDDLAYLKYIAEGIERIEQCTAEGKEAFFTNSMIQNATIRLL